MAKVKDHTLSLLSSLKPFNSLTLILNDNANLTIRIPVHFTKPTGLLSVEIKTNGPVLVNSALYNYLICQLEDHYKKSNMIWVGTNPDLAYIKNSIAKYRFILRSKVSLYESVQV